MRRMYSIPQLEEIVAKVIKSGQVENAKPLYSHNITIWDGAGSTLQLSCNIINNDDTAFTLTSFLSSFTLTSGRKLCNGTILYNEKVFHLVYAFKSGDYIKLQGAVEGIPQANTDCPNLNTLDLSSASFNDTIVKIN